MKRILHFLVLICLVLILATCNNAQDSLAWLDDMILNLEGENGNSCIHEVRRYDYDGEYVYYFESECQDGISVLYDKNGNEIGAIGGYVYVESGVILDFQENRTNPLIVWKKLHD